MSIVKVIEVISEGSSIEEAIKAAFTEVSKTVQNVLQVNVDHIEARMDKKKIKFRLNCKVSFLVDHSINSKK